MKKGAASLEIRQFLAYRQQKRKKFFKIGKCAVFQYCKHLYLIPRAKSPEKSNVFLRKGEACFLTLTWNPFLSLKGDKVENALGENAAMTLDAMEQHMFSVLDTLASRFPPEAEAKILKYQEIIDYLAFSLSHGRLHVEMPDFPVDLDVYLTEDFTADFSKNLITFGEETFLILTLPAFLGAMEKTLRRIIEEMEHAHIPCRHVQRILFFDEKEARKEMERRDRMGLWCRSRKYIKELIEAPLHGKFHGYYNNTLVALVKTADYARVVAYSENSSTRRRSSTFTKADDVFQNFGEMLYKLTKMMKNLGIEVEFLAEDGLMTYLHSTVSADNRPMKYPRKKSERSSKRSAASPKKSGHERT